MVLVVMERIVSLSLFATLIVRVSGLLQFINPTPFGKERDFSNSESYTHGSTVNVAWTPAESGKAASLVLYQLDKQGAWFGDMEYLTQGAVGVTRYTWLVGTRKNLTASNLFYMSIFQEGRSDSDSNSHYFYIQERRVDQPSSTPTPTPASMSSSSLTSISPTTLATSTPSTSSSSSTSVSSVSSSVSSPSSDLSDNAPQTDQTQASASSFPMAAKIGVGVGIPAALAIGLVVGFLLFRRRKNKNTTFKTTTINTGSPYQPGKVRYQHKGTFYGSNLNEAPSKSPVELGPRQGVPYYPPPADHGPQSQQVSNVRYEM